MGEFLSDIGGGPDAGAVGQRAAVAASGKGDAGEVARRCRSRGPIGRIEQIVGLARRDGAAEDQNQRTTVGQPAGDVRRIVGRAAACSVDRAICLW